MESQRRVLWVSPVPPSFDGAGGHLRQAHLLVALAARVDLSLLVSGGVADRRIRQAVRSVVELEVREDDWSNRPRALRRGRDLWLTTGSPEPREVAAFSPVRRAMVDSVRAFDGDLVIVEYAGLAPLISARSRSDQPWTLTLHNIGSTMAAQEAAITAGRRQRWLYERDARKGRRWERRITASFERVVVVSDEDLRSLGSPSGAVVVPNGVDGTRFTPTPLPEAPVLVFTGALYTGPNVDGVQWFCREIFPLVRSRVPDATVVVAGARPVQAVRALAALPGVSVEADVPSILPSLQAVRVAVVPLRIGSGTRLKALEAMAAGRPVVGTTIGLAGLGLVDGRHALMADEPASFAAAVIRLLQDDALAGRLTAEGRRLVDERYDWGGITQRFVEMVLGAPPT